MSLSHAKTRRRSTRTKTANNNVPRRRRLTRLEQARLDEALVAIVEEMKPITVRGVFYQAEVRIPDIIEKSQKGYGFVQR